MNRALRILPALAALLLAAAPVRAAFADADPVLPPPGWAFSLETEPPVHEERVRGVAPAGLTDLKEAPLPGPRAFSVVCLPDTQLQSYTESVLLERVGGWIADHRASARICAVLHTGDVVDNGFKQEQWNACAKAFSLFRGALPFYAVAGNHDLGVKVQSYEAYLRQPFLGDIPEERRFGGGSLFYGLIGPEASPVLLLGIGWNAARQDGALEWIDGVLAAHPDVPCVVLTHGYLLSDGKLIREYAFEEKNIIAKHPSIRLVLCGHSRGYLTRDFPYDDDRDGETDRLVHVLMFNRQSSARYQFRTLTFDPDSRALYVKTFSADPYKKVHWNFLSGPIDFMLPDAF